MGVCLKIQGAVAPPSIWVYPVMKDVSNQAAVSNQTDKRVHKFRGNRISDVETLFVPQ
jgi:hypothetical protein